MARLSVAKGFTIKEITVASTCAEPEEEEEEELLVGSPASAADLLCVEELASNPS